MLPSWIHILLYHEVMKFAVGLSKYPLDLIEFIYEKLIVHLRMNMLSRKDVIFINSFGKELSTEVSFNLFSNKYINYITKNNPIVYIPSKLYIFNNNTPNFEAVRFPTGHSAENPSSAECVLFVSPHVLIDALSILGKIQEWFKVSSSVFVILEEDPSIVAQNTKFQFKEKETGLLKSTLRLNENTTQFVVKGFNLSHLAFKHMARELRGCVNLTHLFFIHVQQFLPIKLGDALATMKSLKIVNMEQSQMTIDTGRAIMKGLSQCQALQELYLGYCVLTDCLKDLLGGVNHAGFHSLLVLGLQCTELCENDLKAIADAARRGQIVCLQHLILTGNLLTNCIEKLVPLGSGHHPGFEFLEFLAINSTEISQADIKHLFRTIQLNKFPALNHLDVSHNRLTGQIARLLPTPIPPGFLSLQELNLSHVQMNKADLKSLAKNIGTLEQGKLRSLYLIGNELTGIVGELFSEAGLPSVGLLDLQSTKLDKTDIEHLSRAVQEGKLPHLRKLLLFDNNLSGMEADIKHFLQTCTTCFRRSTIEVRISISNLPNTEDFQKEICSICQGTSVSINWTEIKRSDDQNAEVRFAGYFPLSGGMEPFNILLPSLEAQIRPRLHPFNR